jgi:16S rRNA G966 N2-methylase RsmD
MEKNILLKIFPQSNNLSSLDQLKYDNEGLWSITLPADADYISQMIMTETNCDATVMDCTAGIGGNVISFCNFFKNVIGVEINSSRYEILTSNLMAYNHNNVTLINDSFINIIGKHNVDAYFIDPPWGGPDYKVNSKVKIKINDMQLIDIINMIKSINCKPILIKLPNNYDMNEFINTEYRMNKIKNYIVLTF